MKKEMSNCFFTDKIEEDIYCEKCGNNFWGKKVKKEYSKEVSTEVVYHDAFDYYNDTIGEHENLCTYITCPECGHKQCIARVTLHVKNERPREKP